MCTPRMSDGEHQLLKDSEVNTMHKREVKKTEALLILSLDIAPEIVDEFLDRE